MRTAAFHETAHSHARPQGRALFQKSRCFRGSHALRTCSRQTAVQANARRTENTTAKMDRRSLGLVGSLLAIGLLPRPAQSAEPFLTTAGARGYLAEEEEKLYRLRQEAERQAREGIERERTLLEEEVRASNTGNTLCATPFGVDIVGITELIALIGALVGGVTSRQRKDEVERLNEQLRKINVSLRQQARAGTVYAPGLTYAPPATAATGAAGAAVSDLQLNDLGAAAAAVASAVTTATAVAPSTAGSTIFSMEEEELNSDQLQCRDSLRSGKRLLKANNGAGALVRFEKALMLSRALGDKVQERRAERGLAAASRLQGQHRAAINHLERVLDISREMREYTGDADAYGVIADCYTDMGELEKAAKFYDKYIERMNGDGPV